MTTPETTPPQVPQDDEIDLIQLAKTLWKGRKTIILSIVVASIIGVAVALLSPKAYTTSTTMVPQVSSKGSSLGGLSSLAAMAGFNLDMSGGAGPLSPVIYPQILQSVPFQLELMNTPFTFSDAPEPVSIYTYYTEIAKPGTLGLIKNYTVGLPFFIISKLRPADVSVVTNSCQASSILVLTDKQEKIRKLISNSVSLSVDAKEGYLTLSVTMPHSLTAAQVAQKAQEMLQRYITEFKIAKASDQLKFVEERYNEKKAEYEKAQARLAAFRDRNKNVTSALALTEEERLNGEFTIAYNVYNELAKQLEQARIQVKEDTPVLSVIQPVAVPHEKSKPNRTLIVAIWFFVGFIFGIGYLLGKSFLTELKEKFNKDQV